MLVALHKNSSLYEQNFLREQKTLYQEHFYAWTKQQVDILKSGAFVNLDIANLIEELERPNYPNLHFLINRLFR